LVGVVPWWHVSSAPERIAWGFLEGLPRKKTSREGLVKRCQGTGNVVFGVQDVLDLGSSAWMIMSVQSVSPKSFK
jgi:hypothetical protein